ncbi:hypothetical protein FHG87_018979 [Trinorchestia longiramus]|nr:hypothetical protein FHG87_018979 [Trinorchestia longiramus]
MESSSDSESIDMIYTVKCDKYRSEEDDQQVHLTQSKLNDLTRDLNLSVASAQLLGFRLREKRLLAPGTTFYWYQVRKREFRKFFMFDEASSLVYCSNIADLIELLDLKVLGLIVGLQGGYTKCPCFLCLWDSRAVDQHYVRQEWPSRQALKPGSHHVVSHPLVEPSKILLPPLHIKRGLMKNFVKALDREGGRFAFLHQKFQRKSMEKIKAGIFDGPQIRELIRDTNFDDALNPAYFFVWLFFESVIANFLGNHKCAQYQKVVDELMENFRQLGARMSGKMHFLRSHMGYFLENCGDFSEEQGERFHQDISVMEECYQGRWHVNFLADYCWCLKRDAQSAQHKRKFLKKLFIHE